MNSGAIANDLAWDKPLLNYTQYKFDRIKTRVTRNSALIGIALSIGFFLLGKVI